MSSFYLETHQNIFSKNNATFYNLFVDDFKNLNINNLFESYRDTNNNLSYLLQIDQYKEEIHKITKEFNAFKTNKIELEKYNKLESDHFSLINHINK